MKVRMTEDLRMFFVVTLFNATIISPYLLYLFGTLKSFDALACLVLNITRLCNCWCCYILP